MILDPARTGSGVNTTTPTLISDYKTTTTKIEIKEGVYDDYLNNVTVDDVVVEAVDAYGNDVTTVDRNGRISAQIGNIIFSKQQADALKSDSGVRIFAYGARGIKNLTGIDVTLSNVTVTPSQESTTTSGAVSGSTTIGLAEVGNISQGMSIRGVGIAASAANPTVVSKNAISGAGNVIASASQTLESGQTLYFDGGTNSVVITGSIKVSNMAIADTTLFFDVEKFLTAV